MARVRTAGYPQTTSAVTEPKQPRIGTLAAWWDIVQGGIDRLQASQRFRDIVSAVPLLQLIGRRRARALFDLCAGFVYTQVLLACVRLDLFNLIAERPLTAAAVSERVGLSVAATERLLRAGVALKLFRRRGGRRYGLGRLGLAVISISGIREMVEHHAMLYADLYDPVALLRGERQSTELGQYWAYAANDAPTKVQAEHVDSYTSLMAASQPMIAAEVLAAYPLHKHHCLLDVGGGDGSFIAAVAAKCPKLELMLFDLPPVAERASARLAAEGYAARAATVGGDLFTDPLPTGADIISLVRVVHDHDDEAVRTILAAAYDALPPGGTLLVAEPMAETKGAEAVGDAYFGLYLLAMGSGRARSPKELKAMLTAAGFERCRLLSTRTPILARVLLARKPS